MCTEGVDRQQQKAHEFMRLMPLTLAVAGLPQAEFGRHLTEGQMEARATSIRTELNCQKAIPRSVSINAVRESPWLGPMTDPVIADRLRQTGPRIR